MVTMFIFFLSAACSRRSSAPSWPIPGSDFLTAEQYNA